MKINRIPALAVAAALVFAACGPGTESADDDARNAVITRDWRVDVSTAAIGSGGAYRAVAVAADGSVYAAAASSAAYKGAVVGGTDVVLTKFTSAGAEVWSRRFGSAAADTPSSVVIDESGRVYVAGTTAGDLGAAPTGIDVFIKGFDFAGTETFAWQQSVTGDQQVRGAAFDPVTSTIVLGVLTATTTSALLRITTKGVVTNIVAQAPDRIVSLGLDQDGSIAVASIAVTSSQASSGAVNEQDAVVTKYAPDGTRRWTKTLDVPAASLSGTTDALIADDTPSDIAVGADGTVFVVGNVSRVGLTTPEQGWVSALARDDGAESWRRMLDPLNNSVSPSSPYTYVRTVTVTGSGEIWVTGESNQSFDVDYASSYRTPFAFKFSAAGGQLAFRAEVNLAYNQAVLDAAASSTGNQLVEVLLASATSVMALVDGPPDVVADGSDVLQQFGTVGSDSAVDVAAGPDGEYFLAGRFANTVPVGSLQTWSDRIVARIAPQGWEAQVYIDGRGATVNRIAVTPDGGVVAAGAVSIPVAGSTAVTYDVWLAKFSRTGERQWLTREAIATDQKVSGLTVSADGTILLTGTTDASWTTGAAGQSAFLARYSAAGTRTSVTQWGGANGTVPTAALPVQNGDAVVASFENDPTLPSGRGHVTLDRITSAGDVIRGVPNDAQSFAAGLTLAPAPDGTYVVAGVVSVPSGQTSTTVVHVLRYSADLVQTMEVTLPSQSRFHRDCVSDMVVKGSGEIVVVGTLQCNQAPATATRNNSMFLRLSATGQLLENRLISKSLFDTQTAVAVGPFDDVWVAGTMTSLVVNGAPGSGDVVVRRYPGVREQSVGSTTVPAPVTTVAATTTQPASTTTMAPVTTVAATTTTVRAVTTTMAPVTTVAATTSTVRAVTTTAAPVTTVAATTTTLRAVTTTAAPVTTVAATTTTLRAVTTTAAPVTTVAATTTVPPATVPPTTAPAPNTTVATPPAGTTVITVPAALDSTAEQVSSPEPSTFKVVVGGTSLSGSVEESGLIRIDSPAGIPVGKPFVSGLMPGNRSVTVQWAKVPGARSYSVVASGGLMQSCSSTVTSCAVTGLVPGYPYQFVVTAFGDSSVASDPSLPVKAHVELGRNRKLAGAKVVAAPTDRKAKLTWRASGACRVTAKGVITAGKKIGSCNVTRRTTKTKFSPATTITFTVIIR